MVFYCDRKIIFRPEGVFTPKSTADKTRPEINMKRRLLVEEAVASSG